MFAFLKTIALLICATILAAVALLVPAHIRTVDSTVLVASGAQGPSPNQLIAEAVNAAHVGPATRIALATQAVSQEDDGLIARSRQLLEENPELRVTGGPDPYYERFLDLVQLRTEKIQTNEPILPLLLPRSERASMSGLLVESRNANVLALLQIRYLQGLNRLHPANHPAGAPYDAGVLTLALLIEGGHFSPSLAQKIGTLANQAAFNNPVAIEAIEDVVIATLSLGRQLEHRSLASLAELSQDLEDWSRMATLFRAQPDSYQCTLYDCCVFQKIPKPSSLIYPTIPESQPK
jgi:hypothetical protein